MLIKSLFILCLTVFAVCLAERPSAAKYYVTTAPAMTGKPILSLREKRNLFDGRLFTYEKGPYYNEKRKGPWPHRVGQRPVLRTDVSPLGAVVFTTYADGKDRVQNYPVIRVIRKKRGLYILWLQEKRSSGRPYTSSILATDGRHLKRGVGFGSAGVRAPVDPQLAERKAIDGLDYLYLQLKHDSKFDRTPDGSRYQFLKIFPHEHFFRRLPAEVSADVAYHKGPRDRRAEKRKAVEDARRRKEGVLYPYKCREFRGTIWFLKPERCRE